MPIAGVASIPITKPRANQHCFLAIKTMMKSICNLFRFVFVLSLSMLAKFYEDEVDLVFDLIDFGLTPANSVLLISL
jgi:hypothetical protein